MVIMRRLTWCLKKANRVDADAHFERLRELCYRHLWTHTTALVDEVAGSRGLAGVNVPDDCVDGEQRGERTRKNIEIRRQMRSIADFTATKPWV